jgi:ATP-dependent Clp protease protease subunit
MAKSRKKPTEIALVGEVDDWEEEAIKALLDTPTGGECVFYIDSQGGSVYGSVAVTTLIRLRKLTCTGMVLGECSSAALLVLAACKKRYVTRYSTLLFHRMRWESEKRVGSREAVHWAKHFEALEKEIDDFQRRLFGQAEKQYREWTERGRYVSGREMVDAGLAEWIELDEDA